MNIKQFQMKNKKKWIVGGCVAGVLALSAIGWNVMAKKPDTKAMPAVTSIQVAKSDISISIQGTGVLTPENSMDMKVPTGIKITEMKAKAGDTVKAGDTLASVDGNTVAAELLAAKEKLTEVEKKFKKADSKKSEYYNLAKDKQNLEEKINLLSEIAKTNSIMAPADGVVTTVNGGAGEVSKTSPKENAGNNQQKNNASEEKGGTSQQNQSARMDLSDVARIQMNDAEGTGEEKESGQAAAPSPIEFPDLKLKAPVTGQPQAKEIQETESYTGTIEWNQPADVFSKGIVYAARITLTAKPGYCFTQEVEPKLEGAAISDVEYKGEGSVQGIAFTAIYPETTSENIEDGKEPSKEAASQPPSDGENEKQNPSNEDDKKNAEDQEEKRPEDSKGDEDDGSSLGGFSGGYSGGEVSGASSGSGGAASGSGDGKEVNTELVSVFTISSGEQMKVNIQVDEMDILSVTLGQKANISLNALPGQVFEGEITHINKVGSANNGVTKYPVEITAKKNDQMLSGMNVSATVLVKEKKDVLTVPAAAVFEESGKSYVNTVYDEKTGTLSGKKEITTGITDGVNIEIVEGIKEGDAVYYQMPDMPANAADESASADEQYVM